VDTTRRKRGLPGQRYGLLTVLEEAKSGSDGRRVWCACDCGTQKVLRSVKLLHAGKSRSCGCLMRGGVAA
jgi:hypothetical protein